MICIITPPQRASLTRLTRVQSGLTSLLVRAGQVHFASMALLPPSADTTGPKNPSLMLELAVDDGLDPTQLIELLVQCGFQTLWFIYGAFFTGGAGASSLVREQWLREFLLRHTNRASGGFVGARDRSVAQILSEAKLFKAARARFDQIPQALRNDRAGLALKLAAWAAEKQQFRWAAEPAPRSFWRWPQVTPLVRPILALGQMVGPLLSVLGIASVMIAGVGILTLAIAWVMVDLPLAPFADAIFGEGAARYWVLAVKVTTVVLILIAFILWQAVSGIRSVTVAAFLLLGFGFLLPFISLWPYLRLGHQGFFVYLHAVEVLVRTGVLALIGFAAVWTTVSATFWLALALSPPFLGMPALFVIYAGMLALGAWAVHAALGFVVAGQAAAQFGIYPALHESTLYGVARADLMLLVILAVFSGIALLLLNVLRLPPFVLHTRAEKMDALKEIELQAAHQVHPSIDKCEARLAAERKPAHMISLTDIRGPNVMINRWRLRFFLWLVTYLGHTIFVDGRLGKADGIRFGHWHVIDNGRRFLFCSNYDGAFGGYLDEFINGASEGTNLFWRWTHLKKRPAAAPGHPDVTRARTYPPTNWGIFRGCKYEQWFKMYARDSMLPHIYRFEAYPHTSALDVQRATRLRESLFGVRTPMKDDQMMRALES